MTSFEINRKLEIPITSICDQDDTAKEFALYCYFVMGQVLFYLKYIFDRLLELICKVS